MRQLIFVIPFLLVGCATSAMTPRLETVPYVDLNRYAGRWYVIANIPYFLERGKVASYDTYSLRPDGKLGNDFTFRKGSFDAPEQTWKGSAWVVNPKTNAEWKVRFIWPLSTGYRVLELDPDYRWAVVSTTDASLIWILARERSLPDATYAEILGRLQARGLDPAKLEKVPQPAG